MNNAVVVGEARRSTKERLLQTEWQKDDFFIYFQTYIKYQNYVPINLLVDSDITGEWCTVHSRERSSLIKYYLYIRASEKAEEG